MSSFFLAGLLVAVWVMSWFGSRRFRLWLAMLSPFGSVVAIVTAFLTVPRGSCEHGCVMGWADSVDGSANLANALLTFPVALAIAVITGIVELILLIRRKPSFPAPVNAPPSPVPVDQDPSWNDLTRGPRRRD